MLPPANSRMMPCLYICMVDNIWNMNLKKIKKSCVIIINKQICIYFYIQWINNRISREGSILYTQNIELGRPHPLPPITPLQLNIPHFLLTKRNKTIHFTDKTKQKPKQKAIQ